MLVFVFLLNIQSQDIRDIFVGHHNTQIKNKKETELGQVEFYCISVCKGSCLKLKKGMYSGIFSNIFFITAFIRFTVVNKIK